MPHRYREGVEGRRGGGGGEGEREALGIACMTCASVQCCMSWSKYIACLDIQEF